LTSSLLMLEGHENNAMGVEIAFGVASAIILLGVISSLLSKRSGVPEIPVLIFLGILLGPASGLVGLSTLNQLAPVLGALAITVILFEGGIHIRISRVASQAGRAVLLAVTGFAISSLSVAAASYWILGWPLATSLVLGSTVGGSSSVVVFSLLKRAGTSDKLSALLGMESALGEVLVVVVTTSLVQVLSGSSGAGVLSVIQGIFQASSVGLLLGGLGGVFWLKLFDKMADEPYKDVATVGFLLGIYALTSGLNGNGAISVLTIGVILGNGGAIKAVFRIGDSTPVEGVTRRFHDQMSFLLRTFFFVYLGSLFNLANPDAFLIGGAVTAVIVGARLVSVLAASAGDSIMRMDSGLMTVLYPRGLAAAVLAQGFVQASFPLSGEVVDVVISVILWSVVSSSLIVAIFPSQISLHLRLPNMPAILSSKPHERAEDVDSSAKFKGIVRSAIVEARGTMEKPGTLLGGTAFGPFKPLLCFGYGQSSVIYDAVSGVAELSRVPGWIQSCQNAKLSGEVNFIVDDLTAFRTISRLRLVERYCDTSPSLGFKVRFLIYEAQKRRIVPLDGYYPETLPKSLAGEAITSAFMRLASGRDWLAEGWPQPDASWPG
jgi:Na+:H+ antiporter